MPPSPLRRMAGAVLLLLASLLAAGTAAAQDAAYTLRGTVVEAGSQRPLSDVQVTVRGTQVREISGGDAVHAPEVPASDADAEPEARGGTDVDFDADGSDSSGGSTDVDVDPADVDDELVADAADDAEEYEYVDDDTEEEAELRRMATGDDGASAEGGDDGYEEYEYVEDDEPA